MTVENFLSHQLIEDCLSFHACVQPYFVNKNKMYCNLKDISVSISLIEKFIILNEDIALPTKIFMGKANFLNLYGSLNIFYVFVADLNLRKNVF